MYEADDKMISIIRDNYNILQSLGSFGINLGFGDKTVEEVCAEQGVDTYTFLAVVNFAMNGYKEYDNAERLSLSTLLHYLKASHAYYIDFQLPFIRKELVEALDENDNLARLILKLYDEYAHSIINHMKYEEKSVFPYVQSLIEGNPLADFNIETFSKHHVQVDQKLKELKISSSNIFLLMGCTIINSVLRFMIYIIMRNGSSTTLKSRRKSLFLP